MTTFDYLLNLVLVGLVVLQLRGRRLDRRALVLPLALVAWAASHYVHGIPPPATTSPWSPPASRRASPSAASRPC
jgi:hypothetical protein